MLFRTCVYAAALTCFAFINTEASFANINAHANFQAEMGGDAAQESEVDRGRDADGKNPNDGKGENHAIFVWSIVLGSIAGGLSIVGLVIWLYIRYEKKRTAELETVANELGLQFSPVKNEKLLAKLQEFRLFNQGHSRRMKNVMTAETELSKLTIFDYQFTTGGGQHSHTHSHTIAAMELTELQLPQFSIRPEGFFDKVGAKLGFQDIDFNEHPEFSSKFVLQSKDEITVRSVFHTRMLDLFAKQAGISVDSSRGLITYMKAGRRKPAEIQEFMAEAYEFFKAFQEQLSRSQSRN